MGLMVCRGTSIMLVCPTDGLEEIANPFLQASPLPVPAPERRLRRRSQRAAYVLARTLLHHRPAPCRVSQEEGEEEGQ